MKKLFRSPAVIASMIVLASVLVVSNFTSAQEAVKTMGSSLEDQMTELIKSQNRLADAMENAFVEEALTPDSHLFMSMVAGTSGAPPIFCWNDALSMTTSAYYIENDWAAEFINSNSKYENFIDLNGDGLLDYLYSNNGGSSISSCIYLNTGSGWERVHVCYGWLSNPSLETWSFKGDCADTSS